MIIQCPECAARFRLPGDKAQPGAKVRCSRCKHVFRIPEEAPAPPAQEPLAPRPNRPTTQDPFGLGDIYQDPAAPRPRAPSAPSLLADRTTGLPGAPLESADDPFARQDPFAATRFGQSQAPDALSQPDAFSQPDPFAPTSFARHIEDSPSDDLDPRGVPFPSFAEEEPAPVDSHYQFGAADPDDFMQAAISFQEEPLPSAPDPSEDRFGVEEGVFERFGAAPAQPAGDAFGGFWSPEDLAAAQPAEEPGGSFWTQAEVGDHEQEPAPASNWFDEPAQEEAPSPRAQAPKPRAEPPRAGVIPGAAARLPKRRAESAKAPAPARAEAPSAPTPAPPRAPEPAPAPARAPEPPRRDDPPPSQSSPTAGLVIAPAAMRAEAEGAGPLQTAVNLFLIFVLVLVGFLGFVAWRNDGLLDFKAMGDMTAAAFGKGQYTPRGEQAASAPPAEGEAPLVVEQEAPLFFPNKDGARLFVVEGRVVNRGQEPASGLSVKATLTGHEGAHEAPAGRALSEEELLEITDEEARAAAYQRVRAEAAALTLQPGQAARFSVVFFGVTGEPEASVEVVAPTP